MAGGVGRDCGGIRWLGRLIEEHRAEVEYELIRRGLRLPRPGKPGWHDAAVVCRFAPAGSPLAARIAPAAAWTLAEHTAVEALDLARLQAWAQAGGKGPQPPRIRRPWEEPCRTETITGELMTMDEMDSWMATRRAAWAAERGSADD